MITLEHPLYIDGVLVLRDGEDADLFWALPIAPHLAATPVGESSFTLLEYRKSDGTGGGFAGLEIELTTPATPSLASATGRDNAHLAPVLFRSGDVSLLTLQGQDQSLVQAVLGATAAPLAPPFHTVFGLELTEQGAALLAQAASTPATPIGVMFRLRFLAQTPALHAHVTMDYSRVYDHFAVGLGFTYYVNVRLDAEFQWLVEHGFITVEINQFTDQADQQRQQQLVLDLVKARIEADFFTTSLPQDAGDGGLPGPLGPLVSNQLGRRINSNSALFVLKARVDVQNELKQFDFRYDGRTVEELTHVVTGFVGAMLPGAPSAPVIRQITADDPFFATLDVAVSVAVDYADLPDLRDAAVTLTYGSHTETFVATAATPGPFRFTCPLTAGQPAYATHSEFHFDPSSPAGPATIAAPDTSRDDRAFALSSADAFTVLRMRATGAGLESDLVSQLRVAARAVPAGGGDAVVSDVLVLDASHPQLDWYRRVPSAGVDLRLLARTDWIDRNGNVHQGDEIEVANGDYHAYGPIQELMTVHVAPAVDWTRVTQLLVELEHNVLGTIETKSALLTPTTPAADLTLALDDVNECGYQWRATATHSDGTTAVSDWTSSDQIYLPVPDPAPTQAGLQVVWIGDVGSVLALRVDFWVTTNGAEQEVASALLQPTELRTTVSLPGPPGSTLAYRYEVHRIDASGDTLVQSGHDDKPVLAVRSSS